MDTAETIVSGTRVHRPLVDKTVTAQDWTKAREELNETLESREAFLRIFKEICSEETEFRPRTDDLYLLRFLRVKKFDVDRAYNALRDHYKFRQENPDLFAPPSAVERILRANIFNYLPHRDHMGRAIFLVKMGNWNPKQVSFRDFVAAGNLVSEYVLDNPVTQINGYIGVWDFGGFSFRHSLPFCHPSNVNLLVTLIQDRFPGRFKVAYCINTHNLVQYAWKLFRKVLIEKFRSRVKLLGSNMADLHQYVDPSILPEEYGGRLPSWSCDDIVRRVRDEEDYFVDDRRYGF